jgi:hypothetical protein
MVWNKLNITQLNMQEIQQEKLKAHALVSTTRWTWVVNKCTKELFSLCTYKKKTTSIREPSKEL